jgi:hypothetical protein
MQTKSAYTGRYGDVHKSKDGLKIGAGFFVFRGSEVLSGPHPTAKAAEDRAREILEKRPDEE